MKYLFLILVCYTVKCENVGNNYFVIKMLEDNLQHQALKDFKKPFQVYWNVPTMQCATKKIPFQNLFEKFGIIQNANDSFIGNKIVIIYNEKDFPAIIYNKTSGKNILRNGGVPQKGNLDNHLNAFVNNLNDKIPDPYFDGVAIIDFESWRPVFRQNFGNLVPHRHLSIEIEKDLHNWWPQIWIKREAALRFEAASRRFMQTTLSVAKEKRPNALWGYYGFPYCFNMRDRDMTEKCEKNVGEENDSIYWLWAESTALFPSIYSSVSLSSSQLSSLIKGRVKEASRVRGRDTPILPYFWYRYRDAGFITEDLEVALTALYQSNASGFIIWGSSNDVKTVEKCNKLLNYVETVLGPKIAKYTKQRKRTPSDNLDNEEIYTIETSTVYDEFSYSRSTENSNTDKMFSTEISSNYNEYTETEENSQTLNNDVMSTTESPITYNDNTEGSQTLNNFNLTLSIRESSTIYSENVNTNQSIKTLNNDQISPTITTLVYNKLTNMDENSQSLKNHFLFSFASETSTAYSEHKNTDQTTETLNNDEIIVYSDFDTEKNVDISNSDDVVSSSESSTFNYENKDHSTANLINDDLVSSSESSTLINDDLVFSSESSTFIYENKDHSTANLINDDLVSSFDSSTLINDYLVFSSESSIFNYENKDHSTATSINDDLVSSSEFLDFDYENKDYSTATVINDDLVSSSESSTFDYESKDHSTTTLINDDLVSSSESSTFEYEDKGHGMTAFINDDLVSSSESSTFDYETKGHGTTTLINDNLVSSSKSSTFDYGNKGHGTTVLSNDDLVSSSESSTFDFENQDHSTTTSNSYDMFSIDNSNLYSEYINTDQNNLKISSKAISTIFDDSVNENQSTDNLNKVKYFKDTLPASDEIKNNDKSTDILIDDEIMTENNEFETIGNEFFNNNMLRNSTEDQSDYLIKVDISTNIESFKQSESKDSTNVDDDYLIMVRNFENKSNLRENITGSKLETVYQTTQAVNNFETITKSVNFTETTNDLDLVVKYIDKTIENIKNEDSTSSKVESFNNIMLLNSSDDASDYLIIPDNITNIETYKQSEHTNIRNADNDNLIIVTDFNIKQNKNINEKDKNFDLDQHSTIKTEANFVADMIFDEFGVTVEDLDPVVAYINKTIDNMKFQDSISTRDDSLFELLKSDEDASDYLINVADFSNKESEKQYAYTENPISDNDYIIIIKNLDD